MSLIRLLYLTIRSRKTEFLLGSAAVALSIAALFVLGSIALGVRSTLYAGVSEKNPLASITVYPAGSGFLKVLNSQLSKTLDVDTVSEFTNTPHVTDVLATSLYGNLASIDVSLLGTTVQTDTLIFGAPAGFVEEDLPPNTTWEDSEIVPVVISRKLLDFYSLSVSASAGLPSISEKALIGTTLSIYPNYSSFFGSGKAKPTPLRAKIVGFSNRTDLLGITIPRTVVERLNAAEGRSSSTYNKILLSVDSTREVEPLAQKLESEGYKVTTLQKEFAEINRGLRLGEAILLIVGILIISTACLTIAFSFWTMILKQSREIGLLRARGATKNHLLTLLTGHAALMGLTGSAFGIALGIVFIQLISQIANRVSSLSFLTQEQFFDLNPYLITALIAAGTVLSVLSCLPVILSILKKEPRVLLTTMSS